MNNLRCKNPALPFILLLLFCGGVIAGMNLERALSTEKGIPLQVIPVEELSRISIRCSPFWAKGAVTVSPPTPKPTVASKKGD